MSPGGWALSWLLLALYGMPVLVVIYSLDLYEREPLSLVAAAFVWGAFAATTLSALGNGGWGLTVARIGGPEFAARWTAALTAPFVEETLKGCGVVLLYLIARDEIDDVMDGFVYGAVCGLGFAIVEDVFYFMSVFGVSLRACSRGSSFGSSRAVCIPMSCTRGSSGWRWGWWSHVGARNHAPPTPDRRRALRARRVRAFPVELPLSICSRPNLGRGRLAARAGRDRRQGAAAADVRRARGHPGAAARTTMARRSAQGEIGLDGVSSAELQVLVLARGAPCGEAHHASEGRREGGVLLHRLQREQVNLAMVASRVSAATIPRSNASETTVARSGTPCRPCRGPRPRGIGRHRRPVGCAERGRRGRRRVDPGCACARSQSRRSGDLRGRRRVPALEALSAGIYGRTGTAHDDRAHRGARRRQVNDRDGMVAVGREP